MEIKNHLKVDGKKRLSEKVKGMSF